MKKVEADVVVIAAGMSGLTAAIAAAEKGASVIVFEKKGNTGGAAKMGIGFFAVESKYQKAQMYDYSVDEAFQDFMTYTHWRTDARLVRRLFEQSGSTIEWIEGMGVEFLGAYQYSKSSKMTWHIVKFPGKTTPTECAGTIMVKAMTDHALKLGVKFNFFTPAKKILTGANGEVTGVIAEARNGDIIEAKCKSVIVATGGFGDNPAMIKEYLGYEWGKDLFTFRIPGLTGDGMKMVWEIGGGKTDVNMEITYNTQGITDVFKTLSETMRQPNLMVNLDGKRFINEEIMNNTTYTGNSLLRQPNRCGFTIINDDILDYYRDSGLDYITWHHAIKAVDRWEDELKAYLSGRAVAESGLSSLHKEVKVPRNLWVCDSIEEISEITGINLKNLKETLEQYNSCCDGRDKALGKNGKYMKAIRGGRYYVARHFPSGYGSLGGIKVNDSLEVVSDDNRVIPGLYASGTDACSIFGDSYNFNMPGSTMGFAINSGRLAGYSCVDYINSDEFIQNRSEPQNRIPLKVS